MRAPGLAALLLLMVASVARAAAPTEVDRILLEPRPAAALRARLLEHARKIEGTDRYQAAQAWLVAGKSALRSGLADSAVTLLQRAAALRGSADDVAALADAWLARARPGDAESARARLQTAIAGNEVAGETVELRERLAAALEALGRRDSALATWRALPAPSDPAWARRRTLALAASPVAAEQAQTLEPLSALAIASRGHDAAVMAALEKLPGSPGHDALERAVAARVAQADAQETGALGAFGATALDFSATDGFPLSGAVLFPRTNDRVPAAVVLLAPGEPLADADSLAAVLVGARRAVLLLHTRGSGGSVGEAWPGPWAIAGREEAWAAACAGDVVAATRALARAAGCDTTRVLLVAGGTAAAAAAVAAERDRAVEALVLASPFAEEPDRAPLLARIAARPVPLFVQIAPEDFFGSYQLTDALFHAGLTGHSRESESQVGGTGVTQWRDDAGCRTRLTRWLAEPIPHAPPAPRRAGRRRG